MGINAMVMTEKSDVTGKVYVSDGSDGYSAGTWGCVVFADLGARGTGSTSDGGFSSREAAEERLAQLRAAADCW
jgi:hypothetical protein